MMAKLYALEISETASAAIMVISGMYGNGEERKEKLKADGYDAVSVQKCVNDLLDVFSKY